MVVLYRKDAVLRSGAISLGTLNSSQLAWVSPLDFSLRWAPSRYDAMMINEALMHGLGCQRYEHSYRRSETGIDTKLYLKSKPVEISRMSDRLVISMADIAHSCLQA